MELIISVNPRNFTLRIDPNMELVKLMRFSVAPSHDFCRAETAFPIAKADAVKASCVRY